MDKSTVRSRAKLVWAIILIACCLRSPITGVGPLVSTIQGDLALGSTAAGLLTTIPLLAFAVASAVVGPLSARLGAGRTMTLSLALLVLGILCRSWCGTVGLFIGTVAVGAGIGINNVLLPGIVKSEFPDRIGPMTGLYSTFMAGFATVSGGVSVPIAAGASASASGCSLRSRRCSSGCRAAPCASSSRLWTARRAAALRGTSSHGSSPCSPGFRR